jgi:molybdate transport system substrate-binding protein
LFTVVCAAVAALVLAACSSSTSTPSASSSGSGKVSGTVVVFAATSLTDAFDKIGAGFEKAHPGVTVEVQLQRQFLAGHVDQPGRAR